MVTRLVTGRVRAHSCVLATCVRGLDAAWGVTIFRIICLLRGCVALEYGLVSLDLHCFLRLARALCCRSRQILASVAFSVYHPKPRQVNQRTRIRVTGVAAEWLDQFEFVRYAAAVVTKEGKGEATQWKNEKPFAHKNPMQPAIAIFTHAQTQHRLSC